MRVFCDDVVDFINGVWRDVHEDPFRILGYIAAGHWTGELMVFGVKLLCGLT